MPDTAPTPAGRISETFRLRREVYDRLVEAKGAGTVEQQVRLTGVARATLFRIRGGDPPSLTSAVKIADALGVPLNALFERVKDTA
ncbi:helix-turn-helix domain-containing protein [Jiangella asiatica]|uniref:XRE family transcriptional regulator n=1 Tax=Jiangella asiatica TaxID=2530372 RepID=A0A4R5CT22_9ACTN|nr:helix-turn-helix transcriptional regulator [Jiangella asiatica]TDE03426.1 XRE family transcriptional regulator [Jiangella asiatica]